MECQYGPRRKGGIIKKLGEIENSSEYKQTCPARLVKRSLYEY